MVLLNFRSNPTGFMLIAAEVKRIMAVLGERGTWLISDEVYARLVYDGSKAAPSFLEASAPEN